MNPKCFTNSDSDNTATKALKVFGRRKMDALKSSFRSAATEGQCVPSDQLENLLRSNGLCPSRSEIQEFTRLLRGRGGVCSMEAFLEIAMQCESVSTTCGMSELIEFFAPYDLQNTGVVSVRVFRNLMLNCGERFTEREVDQVVQAFAARGRPESVDYRAFISTITAI